MNLAQKSLAHIARTLAEKFTQHNVHLVRFVFQHPKMHFLCRKCIRHMFAVSNFDSRSWQTGKKIRPENELISIESFENLNRGLHSNKHHHLAMLWAVVAWNQDTPWFLFLLSTISGLHKHSFRYKIYVNRYVCTNVLFAPAHTYLVCSFVVFFSPKNRI